MTDTSVSKDVLAREAITARAQAIAPYSGYQVGAALLADSGEVITAGNIESSTYGLTLCAERVAIFSALAQSHRQFAAIAIATENGASPCGACRQILWEFAGDIPVYLVDDNEHLKEHTMSDFFPHPFDASHLPGGDERS
ncbi:MAG: cytidine deaminase [Candidatus Marinimicrobia bacterium]|nr:cytidine deaminase [Candidatus Neomarinimicrobiota bacterium]MCF7829262.1 cytidine deaminase [Candidatus Neomarinimicrobiota bacterium]MCF7881085.1 cytidine deaminase [Candidatus Neomarinimicrobiota bacterium]